MIAASGNIRHRTRHVVARHPPFCNSTTLHLTPLPVFTDNQPHLWYEYERRLRLFAVAVQERLSTIISIAPRSGLQCNVRRLRTPEACTASSDDICFRSLPLERFGNRISKVEGSRPRPYLLLLRDLLEATPPRPYPPHSLLRNHHICSRIHENVYLSFSTRGFDRRPSTFSFQRRSFRDRPLHTLDDSYREFPRL